MTSDGGRTHLALVRPRPRGEAAARDEQRKTTEDTIADLDEALAEGSPESPWRGTLFTLRRLLLAQAGASPFRSVDWSAEGEDR